MKKLKIGDLAKIRKEVEKTARFRKSKAGAKVTVHMGTCGIVAGARDILSALTQQLEEKNVTDVIVTTSGCAGLCSKEPMATLEITGEPPVKYAGLTAEIISEIIDQHIVEGTIVHKYALAIGSEHTL
ncbi:MAG: (2Fe-2S) ferredoxin domain-containing protein [bacterium]|nr:(2Fe-2S) ferredoxin domain-containing protein [bacterium]